MANTNSRFSMFENLNLSALDATVLGRPIKSGLIFYHRTFSECFLIVCSFDIRVSSNYIFCLVYRHGGSTPEVKIVYFRRLTR